MSLKLIIGIILPLVAVVSLIILGSININFIIETKTVESVKFNDLFTTNYGSNIFVPIQNITLTNNYFLPKRVTLPKIVVCLSDKEGIKPKQNVRVMYNEGVAEETSDLSDLFAPSAFRSLSYSSYASAKNIEIQKNNKKEVKLLIEPIYVSHDSYDYYSRNIVDSYLDYDELLLIESKSSTYNCQSLESKELDSAVRINVTDRSITSLNYNKKGLRKDFRLLSFNGKLWLMGGHLDEPSGDYSPTYNDVWYSNDGLNWTLATENAAWKPRILFGAAVFKDKMWVIGGWSGSTTMNDVWYSEDGINWVLATPNAQWQARYTHDVVVFDNKLWVLGGYTTHDMNDVWYSEDGINWVLATPNAQWQPRNRLRATAFNDSLWISGGSTFGDDGNFADVWYSKDGKTWIQSTQSDQWTSRRDHGFVSYKEKLWIFGGVDYGYSFLGDIWLSYDGKKWISADNSGALKGTEFSKRGQFGYTVHNGEIWIVGGAGNTYSSYSSGIPTSQKDVFHFSPNPEYIV